MKKVYIETYGCQMNVNDTEVVFSILANDGYARTEDISEADVIMANTCSIRDNAEQRIWGRVDFFNVYRKARKDVVVGILGCMAERLKDALLDTGKVDIVAGPDAYRSLPALLEAIASSGSGFIPTAALITASTAVKTSTTDKAAANPTRTALIARVRFRLRILSRRFREAPAAEALLPAAVFCGISLLSGCLEACPSERFL